MTSPNPPPNVATRTATHGATALGSEAARRILRYVLRQPVQSNGWVAQALGLDAKVVARHLRRLELAGLVAWFEAGGVRFCQALPAAEPLVSAMVPRAHAEPPSGDQTGGKTSSETSSETSGQTSGQTPANARDPGRSGPAVDDPPAAAGAGNRPLDSHMVQGIRRRLRARG